MQTWIIAVALAALLWSIPLAPQRHPSLKITGILNGELLTVGQTLRAESPEPIEAVEFWFTPESRSKPVRLGVARRGEELAYGPGCGDHAEPGEAHPCMREGTFSLDFGRALSRTGEGWGGLSVREISSDMDIASVRVYWDETPPRASFLSSRFNAELSSADGWDVIAQTLDENISVLKVKWILANANSRHIPTFEHHVLGADFAGHAACVPTTVAANLWWLHDTGQWFTRLGFFNEDFTVTSFETSCSYSLSTTPPRQQA